MKKLLVLFSVLALIAGFSGVSIAGIEGSAHDFSGFSFAGGQICLPGGTPVMLDARIPRRFGRGRWQHGEMIGYTSPGVGASIVDVRLNCPPEMTLHTLSAGPD